MRIVDSVLAFAGWSVVALGLVGLAVGGFAFGRRRHVISWLQRTDPRRWGLRTMLTSAAGVLLVFSLLIHAPAIVILTGWVGLAAVFSATLVMAVRGLEGHPMYSREVQQPMAPNQAKGHRYRPPDVARDLRHPRCR